MKQLFLLLLASTLLFSENIEDKLNTIGEDVFMDNAKKPEPKLTKYQKLELKAKKGDAEAQNYMGYIVGTGKNRDIKSAFQWYLKSAKQRFAPAEFNVGLYYMYGLGVKKNPYEAYFWMRKSYENGYKNAKVKLDYLCKEEDICGGI